MCENGLLRNISATRTKAAACNCLIVKNGKSEGWNGHVFKCVLFMFVHWLDTAWQNKTASDIMKSWHCMNATIDGKFFTAVAVEDKSQGPYFAQYWSAVGSMSSTAPSSDNAHRNVSRCAGKHINILSGSVSRGSTCSNVSGLFEGDIHISTPILTSPTLQSYALITHL